MRKSNFIKKALICLTFIFVFQLICINPTMAVDRYVTRNINKNKIVKVEYSNEVMEKLEFAVEYLDQYEKTNETMDIIKVIDYFKEAYDLLSKDDLKLHKKDDLFDYIFFRTTHVLVNSSKDENIKQLVYMSDRLYEAIVKKGILSKKEQFFFYDYICWNYVESNTLFGILYDDIPAKYNAQINICYEYSNKAFESKFNDLVSKPSEYYNKDYENYTPEYSYPDLEYIQINGGYLPGFNLGITEDEDEEEENSPSVEIIKPNGSISGDGWEVIYPEQREEEVIKPEKEPVIYDQPFEDKKVSSNDKFDFKYYPTKDDINADVDLNFTNPNEPDYIDLNNSDYINLYYYKYIGNSCYKTQFKSENGKEEVNRALVTGNETKYCDVGFSYMLDEGQLARVNSNGDIEIEEYDTSDMLSNYTIRYTTDKEKGILAKYKDTKLPVTEENKTSYKNLKYLYEIISKEEEQEVIEDKDSCLLIYNGKVYGAENKEDYSKEEIESIFKDNSEIDVKIDSVNYKNKIKDLLIENKIDNVYYQGNLVDIDYTLQNYYKIFDIKSLSEKLGNEYIEDDNKITIKKDEYEIVYYKNKNLLTENRRLKKTPINLYCENERYYSFILEYLTALNYKANIVDTILYIE